METAILYEQKKTLQSVINKLEKCEPKIKESSAQKTLLRNRLKAFNLSMSLLDFCSDLIVEQEGITQSLEKMKADGKEKTVTYREMLGSKMINKAMLERLEKYINKEIAHG